MASKQELQVTQKRELEKKEETTIPTRIFVPNADIYETKDGLNVVLEMPGVDKNSIDVQVEDDVLKVDGQLDFSKYQGLQPLYTEYNVGHFSRSFRLSNKIDRERIAAELQDGVLSLVLPFAEKAKPRAIRVN
jgi:HSP20 family protein